MKKSEQYFLILTLLIGFLIRLLLTPIQGFKYDVDTWFSWAQRLNEVGFANFYSDAIWTGYTPGFLYIISFLGYLRNFFQINDPAFYILLKLPSIIAEIILGFIIYKIIPAKYILWRKLSLILIIISPAFIFNSAIFGQFDGLFSLFLIVTIQLLTKYKPFRATIFWSIALLLKPQALLLLPVFMFYVIKNRSFKTAILMFCTSILIVFIGFLPFFPINPVFGPIQLVTNLLDHYPYNSIFAYNFWGIFGFWLSDSNTYLNITYQYWGYIFFAFYLCYIFFYGLRKNLSFYSITTLVSLGSFFLVTRMHERYLYPSLIFLIVISSLKKSRLLLGLTATLILIHFLDLYYVYIYYNQFQLKLPETIYAPFLYNLASNNISAISFFSTLIFVLMTITIVLSNNENKFEKD